MKHYTSEHYECDAPDKYCLFCKHCTDVFWDYTNGPYMCIGDTPNCGDWKKCNSFEEEEVEDD